MSPQWHRQGRGWLGCNHCDTVYTRITLNWRRHDPGPDLMSLGRCHGRLGPLCPFVSRPLLPGAWPLPHWLLCPDCPVITLALTAGAGAVGLGQSLLALATVLTLHRSLSPCSRSSSCGLCRLFLLSSGCGWFRLGGCSSRHSTGGRGFFLSFP